MHPAIEPGAGAATIDRRRRAQVLAKVEQHVDQAQAHLARRGKRVGVIAPVPHGPVAAAGAVDGARAANRESLKATRQIPLRVRFHDEVEVVALDGEVQEPERTPARGGERAPKLRENRVRAQRGNSRLGA